MSFISGYVPILYAPDAMRNRRVLEFSELYGESLELVDSDRMDALVVETWDTAPMIVVCDKQRPLAVIAAAIAAEKHLPLFLETPAADIMERLGVEKAIVVGTPSVPQEVVAVNLPSLDTAQDYYNGLLGPGRVAVLTSDDDMSFLAAEIAAYHRGPVFSNMSQVRSYRPTMLAWVTRPEAVTSMAIRTLYDQCRFSTEQRVYDMGIGIITGFTATDASLLLARAYAYPQLVGSWKARMVNVSPKWPTKSLASEDGPYDVLTLGGSLVTADGFAHELQHAGLVIFDGHGSPSGIALASGRIWPPTDALSRISPLIFVAESCATADITRYGVGESVALRILAAGAVAYVGSLETGGVGLIGKYTYAFSTPDCPLSELVRLQNAARMDTDAASPRAVLFGEPSFHQFDEPNAFTQIADSTGQNIKVHGKPFRTTISVDIADQQSIIYAKATISPSGQTIEYGRGTVHWDKPLATAMSYGHQRLLLEWPGGEGELVVFTTRPFSSHIKRFLSQGLLGLEAIMVSLLGRPGTDLVVGLSSMVGLLRILQAKRKRLHRDNICGGIVLGGTISVLVLIFHLALGFIINWPVVLAFGFGGIASAWLSWHDQPGLQELLVSCCLFTAPLLLTVPLALLSGASLPALSAIALGLFLLVGAYFASAAIILAVRATFVL